MEKHLTIERLVAPDGKKRRMTANITSENESLSTLQTSGQHAISGYVRFHSLFYNSLEACVANIKFLMYPLENPNSLDASLGQAGSVEKLVERLYDGNTDCKSLYSSTFAHHQSHIWPFFS